MSAEQLSELDYVFKRDAAGKVKTDAVSSLQTVSAANEAYPIVPIVSSQNIWMQGSILKTGKSNSLTAGIVRYIFEPMTSIHTTDLTSLKGISWNSGYTNWVNPSFNLDFVPQFYAAPLGTSGTPSTNSAFIPVGNTSVCPFVFDYGSGILTFLSSTPSLSVDLTNTDSNALWISGYVYQGTFLSDVISGPTAPTYYSEFQISFSEIPPENSFINSLNVGSGLAYSPNETAILTNLSDPSTRFEAIVSSYNSVTGAISLVSITNVLGTSYHLNQNFSINLAGQRGIKWYSYNTGPTGTYSTTGRIGDFYIDKTTGYVYHRIS